MKAWDLECRKFHRVAMEREDRDLNSSETAFLERHSAKCPECRRYGQTAVGALNMLRGATLTDVTASPMFEERVIRRFRARRVKDSLRYWSPAFVGALIACVAVFASLAMVTRPDQLKSAQLPSGSAVLYHEHSGYPNLELNRVPRISE